MLHVESHGAGPALVFLHGMPTTVDVFDGLIGELAADHACHVVHMPGYGKSPSPTLPVSFDELHTAVEKVLRGLAGTLTLVGTSGGAWHALALALRGTVEVSRIALFAGLAELSAAERDGFRQFAVALRAGANLKPLAAPRFLSPASQADPARCAAVEAWLEAAPAEVIASELDALAATPDLIDDLSRLALPVLLRVGALDQATPPSKSETIARHLPNATLQVVPDVAHALLLEDTAACVAAVRAFVAGG